MPRPSGTPPRCRSAPLTCDTGTSRPARCKGRHGGNNGIQNAFYQCGRNARPPTQRRSIMKPSSRSARAWCRIVRSSPRAAGGARGRGCASRGSGSRPRAGSGSAGCRPFSAHAVSHASSQRSTSMPFIESVPTKEYRIAVNAAPFKLSEPCERSRPIASPLRILSARLSLQIACVF